MPGYGLGGYGLGQYGVGEDTGEPVETVGVLTATSTAATIQAPTARPATAQVPASSRTGGPT